MTYPRVSGSATKRTTCLHDRSRSTRAHAVQVVQHLGVGAGPPRGAAAGVGADALHRLDGAPHGAVAREVGVDPASRTRTRTSPARGPSSSSAGPSSASPSQTSDCGVVTTTMVCSTAPARGPAPTSLRHRLGVVAGVGLVQQPVCSSVDGRPRQVDVDADRPRRSPRYSWKAIQDSPRTYSISMPSSSVGSPNSRAARSRDASTTAVHEGRVRRPGAPGWTCSQARYRSASGPGTGQQRSRASCVRRVERGLRGVRPVARRSRPRPRRRTSRSRRRPCRPATVRSPTTWSRSQPSGSSSSSWSASATSSAGADRVLGVDALAELGRPVVGARRRPRRDGPGAARAGGSAPRASLIRAPTAGPGPGRSRG